MQKAIVTIDLGNGELCSLSEDLSARILAAARRRKKSAAHIIGLALRQKIHILEEGRVADLAEQLDCSPREAQDRAVCFMLTYIRGAEARPAKAA